MKYVVSAIFKFIYKIFKDVSFLKLRHIFHGNYGRANFLSQFTKGV